MRFRGVLFGVWLTMMALAVALIIGYVEAYRRSLSTARVYIVAGHLTPNSISFKTSWERRFFAPAVWVYWKLAPKSLAKSGGMIFGD
jgi:hypothetical protein